MATTMAPIIAVLKPMIILGVVLLVLKIGIDLLVARRKRKSATGPTYEKQEHLLTQAELKFYSVLKEAMEEASVPLLRFQARSSYTAEQIAQKLALLKQKDAA